MMIAKVSLLIALAVSFLLPANIMADDVAVLNNLVAKDSRRHKNDNKNTTTTNNNNYNSNNNNIIITTTATTTNYNNYNTDNNRTLPAAITGDVAVLVTMEGSNLVSEDNNNNNNNNNMTGSRNCSEDHGFTTGDLIARYGILPMAFLGMLGNMAAMWVWHAETHYNATTFLFKYLALCDILYLLFNAMFVFLLECPCCGWPLHAAVTHTRNVFQIVSVHVTLLVAVTRWMAVSMPLRVARFLTQRYIINVCLLIALWCGIIEGVEVLRMTALHLNPEERTGLLASHEVFGYVLPWFFLLVFSLHLIWTTRRRLLESHYLQRGGRWNPGRRENDDDDDNDNNDNHPHNSHHHHNNHTTNRDHRQRLNGKTKTTVDCRMRRLTLTVLCVALSSFFAYPIGVTVEMVSLFEFHRGHDTLATLGGLLQVINSGINVVFYWAFISRFRELLRNRLPKCLKRRNREEEERCCHTEFSAAFSAAA